MRGRRAQAPLGPARMALATLLLLLVPLQSAWAAGAGEDADQAKASSIARADDLVQRVVERYLSHDSYRIAFTQETYWALADTVLTAKGELLVERPLSVSIAYDDGSRVASNGESLWVYTEQTNQFFATTVDSSDIVIDPPRLLKQYEPDPEGPFPTPSPDSVIRINEIVVSLRPTGGVGEPAHLDVYIDSESLLVFKLFARSSTSDWTRYVVHETTFDVETSPDDFVFARPPGSRLITGSRGGP